MISIEPGQVYRAVAPFLSAGERHPGARVLVKAVIPFGSGLHGAGSARVVTLADDGRELRPRLVRLNQLHASATTLVGELRRTGYALEVTR